MPIAMAFAVVATANHFVLDVAVSVVVVARRTRRRGPDRAVPQRRRQARRRPLGIRTIEASDPGYTEPVSSRTASSGVRRQGSPFFVAHRAGNDLAQLSAAEAIGIDFVEADIRLFRGRLEVRHLKTLGPFPVLWDRWQLANPFAPRLQLHELLAAVGPRTELMLDLKGRGSRLADGCPVGVAPFLGHRRLIVCARSWALLEPFEGLPGIRDGLLGRALRVSCERCFARPGPPAAGCLGPRAAPDPATVAELRSVADLVMTWPANAAGRARELAAMGVDGLITDRFDLVHELGRAAEPAEATA